MTDNPYFTEEVLARYRQRANEVARDVVRRHIDKMAGFREFIGHSRCAGEYALPHEEVLAIYEAAYQSLQADRERAAKIPYFDPERHERDAQATRDFERSNRERIKELEALAKGPTRAELTAEQSATARKAHYAATELDDDAPLPKGDWEE